MRKARRTILRASRANPQNQAGFRLRSHVPLLYRSYGGNGSDQGVLTACLEGLRRLHEALDEGEACARAAQRTLVRDGGFWSPQLELDLDVAGYYSLISLPLGHAASAQALQMAAGHGAMKRLSGKLAAVRAARMRTTVGALDRTLVVVESEELLAGQKRGIAVALRKAKVELRQLERLAQAQRISGSKLAHRAHKALARLRKSHHRWRETSAFGIGDHHGLAAFHHGDDRVGGAQIDSDDFAH